MPANEFLKNFQAQKISLIIDDASDETRGIFVAPAQNITTDIVNKLISFSGGLTFVAMPPERISAFLLQPMSRPRSSGAVSNMNSGYCVSVEAREGVTTGISAADRAATLKILGAENPNPRKLVKPGHIFPVEVRSGGTLVKNALPEAALDVVRLAGFTEAAFYLDVLNESGDLADEQWCKNFAEAQKIPVLTISELVKHRLINESLVKKVAQAKLPTELAGELTSYIYTSIVHEGDHLALVKGEINPKEPTLTRVQAEFTFGDVFGGDNPPTRKQLDASLRAIGAAKSGVLIYLRRPSLGQVKQQISTWDEKFSEKPATMMREYGLGAQILADLGVKKIALLTSSHRNIIGLKDFGIEIVEQRALEL